MPHIFQIHLKLKPGDGSFILAAPLKRTNVHACYILFVYYINWLGKKYQALGLRMGE